VRCPLYFSQQRIGHLNISRQGHTSF
jgi:hypothetical protein